MLARGFPPFSPPLTLHAEATTALLHAVCAGDESAADSLLPHVYDELRRLAQAQVSNEPGEVTVSATGLVHEAYLRLSAQRGWRDRAHFMAVASRAMRRILVDRARARQSLKRGGVSPLITLDEGILEADRALPDRVLSIHQALGRLAEHKPDLARLVEMRFFGGMSIAEIAEVRGVSRRTATRDWARAKTFLHALLS